MHRHSTTHARHWMRAALLAAVLAELATASQARTASADQVRHEQAAAMPRASQAAGIDAPWWAGFNEAPLAALQRAALARASSDATAVPPASAMPIDAQVTTAYIAMRVFNVRWQLAMQMRESLERQHKLLAGAAPVASLGQALATIGERKAQSERFAAMMLGQRDAAMDALARLTGKSPQDLFGELQVALASRDMPLFDAQTPERLPRSVILGRRDVSASRSMVSLGRRGSSEAQHDLAIGPASLSGWIAAAPGGLPATLDSQLPDVKAVITVAAQAESEISADLDALQRRTVQTGRLFEVVKSRQMELDAVKQRLQVGAATEQEVIGGFQTLLVNDDALAVSAGELAYAWIRLQASTGGQALQARGLAED
jgi:hypothetical protein